MPHPGSSVVVGVGRVLDFRKLYELTFVARFYSSLPASENIYAEVNVINVGVHSTHGYNWDCLSYRKVWTSLSGMMHITNYRRKHCEVVNSCCRCKHHPVSSTASNNLHRYRKVVKFNSYQYIDFFFTKYQFYQQCLSVTSVHCLLTADKDMQFSTQPEFKLSCRIEWSGNTSNWTE